MKFEVTINCDNAAFGEDTMSRLEEVAQILKTLSRHLKKTYATCGPLRDLNGNVVGQYRLLRE
jgi:hypothetical protein